MATRTRPILDLRLSLDVSAVPASPAGAGRYTLDLAAALARRGDIELHLITRTDDEARWTGLGATVTVYPVAPGSRPLRLAWEQVALPRLLERISVDVHHAPHYTMPERSGVPQVVTVHDLTFFDHPEWHERAKVVIFRRAIRQAARRAQGVVCVSQATARGLTRLFGERTNVAVIPHGVDLDRFGPTGPDDAAVLTSLGVRRPYVGFVGTLEPRKDVPTLVRAFDRIAARHPDLHLVLAGTKGWGAKAVDAAVTAAIHGDRVVRTGYVPDAAVPALLRQAVCIAYPSLEEGFGLPALEALACGVPLVTTQGSAMEEVTGGAALLVPAGDTIAVAEALEALVAGGAAVAARAQDGLSVAARYTWEASAAAHVGLYRAVQRTDRGGGLLNWT